MCSGELKRIWLHSHCRSFKSCFGFCDRGQGRFHAFRRLRENSYAAVTLNCIQGVNVVCTVYHKTFLPFLDRGTALSNDSFPILRAIVRGVQGRGINLHLRLNHHVGVLARMHKSATMSHAFFAIQRINTVIK